VRYARGSTSPEGFYRDSYDYASLKRHLLDPLGPGGDRRYRRKAFDHRLDQRVQSPEAVAGRDAILIFDGLFLHRPELRGHWDYSIFLEVGFNVSIPRGAQRGEGSPDPSADCNRRYIEGQLLYFSACDPRSRASLVIDNEDLLQPKILAENRPRAQRG